MNVHSKPKSQKIMIKKKIHILSNVRVHGDNKTNIIQNIGMYVQRDKDSAI